ncbi:MAG: nucleotidyltransferase domain-containing protein, partial [Dehalococcoidia bacterium]
MGKCGWDDAPAGVRAQVAGLIDAAGALLGSSFSGAYLHGSLAMGCFNPARSDIDLLIVSERSLLRDTKLGLVQSLLDRSGLPAPIEISFLSNADLHPWRYPTPYQLHFSETWRERLSAD